MVLTPRTVFWNLPKFRAPSVNSALAVVLDGLRSHDAPPLILVRVVSQSTCLGPACLRPDVDRPTSDVIAETSRVDHHGSGHVANTRYQSAQVVYLHHPDNASDANNEAVRVLGNDCATSCKVRRVPLQQAHSVRLP